MKKLVAVTLIVALAACSRVPITDRRQVNLVPSSMVEDMGKQAFAQYISENTMVASSDSRAEMVNRVGLKIKGAVETYLRDNKMTDRIEGFAWEFRLVQDDTPNAFALPGGKVVIHTGILPLTRDEAGLATVMSHEIAHVIARHGNERLSQQLAAQLGGMALSVAVSEKPEVTQQIFLNAYGVGSTLGILKYSRTHESEADKLGLIFMAMAGYNPNEAIGFWERMAAQSGGSDGPELLRTHPTDENRIRDIKKYIPTAMKYYTGTIAGE